VQPHQLTDKTSERCRQICSSSSSCSETSALLCITRQQTSISFIHRTAWSAMPSGRSAWIVAEWITCRPIYASDHRSVKYTSYTFIAPRSTNPITRPQLFYTKPLTRYLMLITCVDNLVRLTGARCGCCSRTNTNWTHQQGGSTNHKHRESIANRLQTAYICHKTQHATKMGQLSIDSGLTTPRHETPCTRDDSCIVRSPAPLFSGFFGSSILQSNS